MDDFDYEKDMQKRQEQIRRIEENTAFAEYQRRKLFRRTLLLSFPLAAIILVTIELALIGIISIDIALPIAVTLVAIVSTLALEYYNTKSTKLNQEQRFLRKQIMESEGSKDMSIINRLERIDYELSSLRSFQSELLDRGGTSRDTTDLLRTLLHTNEELKEMLRRDLSENRIQVRPAAGSFDFVSSDVNPERLLFVYSQISSEFAHSIKAPLASIDVALTNLSQIIPQLLKEKQNSSDDQVILEFLQNASSSVELIRSILKQGAGFSSEVVEEIDLPMLLRKAERLCRDATNSKSILNIDLQVSKFVFYRLNLFIGIVELLRNAFEAAGDNGHVKVTCDYRSTKKGKPSDLIEILVTNDGKTIPNERMQQIFNETYSTKGAGHGLGLRVVRDALKSVNGHIEILKNTDPRLTTFRITFEPVEMQKEDS